MELRLIKAGLTVPGKPASVMLFAGLTGVGKTELAKTLAKFYSSSKLLQTYTMGNFTESHSISGIIGVPPGYVGHEQGGRIINDLNSDPYCVFLLDEAEKPHPDIWKPFLNLFDEGWIVDQRGTKAFADRAIFILTSNAGHEIISRMTEEGAEMDKIIEEVKKYLPTIRHERSPQSVFTPEFLARIGRTIIFKPLDQSAMEGLCRKMLRRMQKEWEEKREKTIVVPDNLIEYIAEQSHLLDKKSGYKEGARIVRRMIRELIEDSIQQEAGNREDEYKACNIIELIFIAPTPALPYQTSSPAKVTVELRTKQPLSPDKCIVQAEAELRNALTNQDFTLVYKAIPDCLARLETGLERWAREHGGERASHVSDGLLESFREAISDLDLSSRQSIQQAHTIIEKLITVLNPAGGSR